MILDSFWAYWKHGESQQTGMKPGHARTDTVQQAALLRSHSVPALLLWFPNIRVRVRLGLGLGLGVKYQACPRVVV